jgi:tetratricopeptide (TPR) repeat protein/tRNA A-37 threonylcarbamoyl transferase component Bud32
MIGTKLIDRYEVVRELGRGGMGIVYLAKDPVLEREVAVKMISPELLSDEIEERFQREARIVAQIDHPSIVPVYDFHRGEDGVFFVMPYVRGDTLREVLEGGGMEQADVVEMGVQVADALDYSHALGVVHRDIKPENIMISKGPDGRPRIKVMDYGVAFPLHEPRITAVSGLVGTLAYLSPEQATGGNVDGRSDLYALGAVMYECLVGDPPFGGDLAETVHSIIHDPPNPLRSFNPALDASLERVVLRCLAKRPSDRHANGRELVDELIRCLEEMGGNQESTVGGFITLDRPGRGFTSVPMVGRHAELRELRKHLKSAIKGACQLGVVGGEAGIGKTRLLAEIERMARAAGALVLHGRCMERLERSFRFQGFCELVQDYYRQAAFQKEFDTVDLSDLADDLLRMFPMLAEIPQLAAHVESDLGPETSQETFENKESCFETIGKTLSRIGDGKPLLLVFEDLHGADVSVEALQYLLRRLGPTQTFMVGTYRSTEVDEEHPVGQLLHDLGGDPNFVSFELKPLSLDDHWTLLASILESSRVDDKLNKTVYEATKGNPFFVLEVVQSLLDQGDVVANEAGSWVLDRTQGLSSTALPETVHEAVNRRIERLSKIDRELLSTASVLGQSLSSADLELLWDRSSPIEPRLDLFVENGYLEEDADCLAFSSGVMREVLYGKLTYRRRRQLHKKYAEALERRHGTRLDRVVGELANHWSRAQEPLNAVKYSLWAGRQALDSFSPDDVIRYSRTALRFITNDSWTGDTALEGDARVLLAKAYWTTGKGTRALRECEEALTVYEQLGVAPTRRLDVLLLGAQVAWDERDITVARGWLRLGLKLARDCGSLEHQRKLARLEKSIAQAFDDTPAVRDATPPLPEKKRRKRLTPAERSAELAEKLGDNLLIQGEYRAARDAYESAREKRKVTTGSLEPHDKARFLLKIAHLTESLGQYDEALKLCNQAIDLAEGDSLLMARLEALAGLICCSAGRPTEATQWIDRGQARVGSSELQDKPGRVAIEASLHRARGNILVEEGHPVEAIESYHRSLELFPETSHRWEHTTALFNLGDAYAHKGDYEAALEYLDQAYEEKSALGDKLGLAYTFHARAKIHLDQGDLERAMTELLDGLALATDIADKKITAMLRLVEAGLHLRREAFDKAEETYNEARRIARKAKALPEVTEAQLGLAAVSRERGQLTHATKIARNAHELADQLRSRVLLVATTLELGEINLAMGEFGKAERQFQSLLAHVEATLNPYRRFEILLAMARVKLVKGQFRDALPFLKEVRLGADEIGNVRQRGLASLGLAEIHGRCADRNRALAAARAALDDFTAIQSVTLEARVYELLTELLRQSAQYEAAELHGKRAIEIYEKLGERADRQNGRAHLALGYVYFESVQTDKMKEAFQIGLKLLERLGDRAGLVDAHRAVALTVSRDEPQRALGLLHKSLKLSEEVGYPLGQVFAYGMLAEMLRRLGRLRDAMSVLGAEDRMLRESGYRRASGANLFRFATVFWAMANLEKTLDAVNAALVLSEEFSTLERIHCLELRGRVQTEVGLYVGALRDLNKALLTAESLSHQERVANVRHARALYYLSHGRFDQVAKELDAGRKTAVDLSEETIINHGYLVRERLEVVRARLGIATGKNAEAEAILGPLIAVFEELETPFEELDARLALAEAQLGDGSKDVERDLRLIAERAKEMALVSVQADAVALLGSHTQDLATTEEALKLANQIGAPLRRARIASQLSEMRRKSGDEAGAEQSATLARRLFEKLLESMPDDAKAVAKKHWLLV